MCVALENENLMPLLLSTLDILHPSAALDSSRFEQGGSFH